MKAAVAAVDAMIASLEGDDSPESRKQLMVTMVSKGTILEELGNDAEAIGSYAEVAERFGEDDETATRMAVAVALLSKADCLGRLGRWEDAIATHKEINHRLAEDGDSLSARVELVGALVRGVDHLAGAGRIDEATALARSVADRFADADEAPLRTLAFGALRMSGTEQANAGRLAEGLETFDELLARAAGEDSPAIQDNLAWTMVEKAKILGLHEFGIEALALLDKVIERFGDSERQRQSEAVTHARELLSHRDDS